MKLLSLATLSLVCVIPGVAEADEQMRVLTHSGSWITMAHTDTMLAQPDVCLTVNVSTGVAFRAAPEGVELRVVNDKWTLPVNVTGSIHVAVGKLVRDLPITSNTDSMVSGTVDTDDVRPLFAEMDKQSSMELVVGKSKPLNVSLSGSTVATNAFRTCAGIRGEAPSDANNPFK